VRPQLDGKGMSREDISYALRNFTDGDERPVFWGYFPAYDWVAFVWLFGGVEELPFHFPSFASTSSNGRLSLAILSFRTRKRAVITRSPTLAGRKRLGGFLQAAIPPEPTAAPPNAKTRPALELLPLCLRRRQT
jgi:hypothetical protein